MMLDGKRAVIYGGGGSIGGAVARAFAREGATVFLAGRTQEPLDRVAADIRAAGGRAETALVDALDERAVDAHADEIAAGGGIDVSLNVVAHGDVQGTPMAEMAVDDYLRPVETAVRTSFITWRAAARHMASDGGGTILVFGGDGDPMRGYSLGGLQTAFTALESMRRQLAMELGPQGVRVVTLRTGGVPESIPASFAGREAIERSITELTMLGRAATLEDVGNAAVFAASDWARTMTAATINVSCGALID
ncbi:SDR family NAD(P)-dependent oxidoreductase [Conexibacter arvalis]|uniref:NAD(P)-dependent dehydrogenase (Short-subunit alcohol dehydrogenase family) n=1 Tax=Conexibacter arvalis TaxID=912552 RepID=A0A840IB41_9ACTN|nr:SDR family oxidoreductase [Conexibacter arvalis]MBB4661324.1 NAD(P)-dependent dehydrogenase (short-subunit alcohol dehydrogenase family) [Conexibacter arvalis]